MEEIKVKGAPYEVENEDGAKRIIIGDEDETIIGPAEYEITYVLDMGDDRISEYDELFYNLIGNGWDTRINHTEFHVTFEKDADLSGAEIYAGAFESRDTERASWAVNENRIDGTVEELQAHESLTVFTRLPGRLFCRGKKGKRDSGSNSLPAQYRADVFYRISFYHKTWQTKSCRDNRILSAGRNEQCRGRLYY